MRKKDIENYSLYTLKRELRIYNRKLRDVKYTIKQDNNFDGLWTNKKINLKFKKECEIIIMGLQKTITKLELPK